MKNRIRMYDTGKDGIVKIRSRRCNEGVRNRL